MGRSGRRLEKTGTCPSPDQKQQSETEQAAQGAATSCKGMARGPGFGRWVFPFICRVWRRVLRGGVPYSRALERLMRYVRLQNEGP
jgi:hypothetical protein